MFNKPCRRTGEFSVQNCPYGLEQLNEFVRVCWAEQELFASFIFNEDEIMPVGCIHANYSNASEAEEAIIAAETSATE